MAKYAMLYFIGLIHFIELIQTSPIQQNFDVTLENGIVNLGEIDTGDEEPVVYVFKRMVENLATEMNGKMVSNVRYQYPGVDVQQTTMIVDGKPFVMGSFAVTDPNNGYSTMTVYVAGKNGYRTISKVSYRAKNREKLLKSAVGR